MKTFVATLAINACVGTLLLFESVNGDSDSIKILSPDGSYTHGNIEISVFSPYPIPK